MKYDKLFNFIKNEMEMAPAAGGTSFFYQPIMIRTLLKNDGKASREKIEEDIKVEYDMTVRNNKDKIIQFKYF